MGNLKVLATELSKIKIHPTGNPDEDFSFAVRAVDDALICKHNNIRVVVNNFQQIDPKNWNDSRYPAVERGTCIVRLSYQAKVNWQVGKVKGEDTITLGHPLQRDKLLMGLETHSVERGVIDTLLFKLDRLAGELLPDNLPSAGTDNPSDREADRVTRPRWKIF